MPSVRQNTTSGSLPYVFDKCVGFFFWVAPVVSRDWTYSLVLICKDTKVNYMQA